MTHFDSFYANDKTLIHETDLDETLNILNKFIDSRVEEDILSKVSSFLGTEEIKTFMEDSLRNFVYKKVFNLAYMLYKENYNSYQDEDSNEKSDVYINDFKEFFKKKFFYNYDEEDDLEQLGKNFYNLVLSPDNSRNDSFTSKLRKYAKNNNIDKCYLCGKTVDFDVNKKVTLLDSLDYKFDESKKQEEKDRKYIISYINRIINLYKERNNGININETFTSKEYGKIKFMITDEQFKKLDLILNEKSISKEEILNNILKTLSEKQIFEISMMLEKKEKESLNKHLGEVNLNRLNSIFEKTYYLKNNASCEIEHNFPAQWGGDLSNNNIFVACHTCNNKKGNMAFYTDIDYSNVFSNSKKLENIKGSIKGEIKIALKMKQKFKCKNDHCNNNLLSNQKFYIINEMKNKEIDFFNLSFYCEECIDKDFANKEILDLELNEDIEKIKKLKKEEFIKEYCINI